MSVAFRNYFPSKGIQCAIALGAVFSIYTILLSLREDDTDFYVVGGVVGAISSVSFFHGSVAAVVMFCTVDCDC